MTQENFAVFKNRHKFQDDLWGQITLNDLERDVIDTPEFQRLFRTSQLGFVHLVYQTANHTRGAHCIGACHIADKLVCHLLENTQRLRSQNPGKYAAIDISPSERVLIRLGALLHDISHIPLSHDIERKTHKIFYPGNPDKNNHLKIRSHYGAYEKHDSYGNNPLLYLLLCDTNLSVLARVLTEYSPKFYEYLQRDAAENIHEHLQKFVSMVQQVKTEIWDPDKKLLPSLLFHLLSYEDLKEASEAEREIAIGFDEYGIIIKSKWGLGPESICKEMHKLWYQPFRHDIIGNTLSADLIDYLRRDPQRLGTERKIDLHLLNYYVLVNYDVSNIIKSRSEEQITGNLNNNLYYRCAIDLHDYKRGTTRVGLINDIFRLLDLRQEIHEKAVMHRVVHGAIAMLSRALMLLGNSKPGLNELLCIGQPSHSLQGEDFFFGLLLKKSIYPETQKRIFEAERIVQKLIDRRIYRPLMIIPGDRAVDHFQSYNDPQRTLRTLATIVDSSYYSSFLLFVSACVEKYLQGVFETDDDLCKYIHDIAQEINVADTTEKAMHLNP